MGGASPVQAANVVGSGNEDLEMAVCDVQNGMSCLSLVPS